MEINLINIKLDNIEFLRVRCDHCKAVVEYPVNKTMKIQTQCVNCDCEFTTKAIQDINDLIGALKKTPDIDNSLNKTSINIEFIGIERKMSC